MAFAGEAGKFPTRFANRSDHRPLARIHLAERTGANANRHRPRHTRIRVVDRTGLNRRSAHSRRRSSVSRNHHYAGHCFLTRSLPADAGVVISASHNPYQDNGIKVFDPSGRKLDEATERRIERDVAAASARMRTIWVRRRNRPR